MAGDSRFLGLTDNLHLARRVENFRYQLGHLDLKLNRLQDRKANEDWGPSTGRTERIRAKRDSIMKHVNALLGDEYLADYLGERIEKLE
jgi:hypothetical protein